MSKKPRYVYFQYPQPAAGQPSPFVHGVMDTSTGKPAATLDTKEICETVAKYMTEADERAKKDLAPYVQAINGLSKVMVHTMIVQAPIHTAPPALDAVSQIIPPPGEV